MPREALRVLVIVDDPEELEALATLIQTRGFEVHCAASRAEGVGVFISTRPAIVVVDLGLADEEGFKVIRLMRAKAVGHVVIIAYSGFQRLAAKALAAGADGFVLKPNVRALEDMLELRCRPTLAAPRRKRNREDA